MTIYAQFFDSPTLQCQFETCPTAHEKIQLSKSY